MEKRVLLAIFLSFLVLYLYQALLVKPVPKGAAPAGSSASSAQTHPAAEPQAPRPALTPGLTAEAPSAPARAETALVGDTIERDVRVDLRDVIAIFTNRGARLKSWRLKRFLDPGGAPLELIANELAGSAPLPFSVRVADAAVTETLNAALYTVSGAPVGGGDVPAAAPIDLRFEYRNTAGVRAVKEFHLEPSSYIVSFRTEVTQGDQRLTPTIQWGPAVGDVVTEVSRFTQRAEGLHAGADGKAQRLTPKDIAKESSYAGDFAYAGVDDQYFLTAALFTGPIRISYQTVSIPPPAGSPAGSKEQPRDLISWAVEPTAAGAGSGGPMQFFAGPKDFDVLRAIDPHFVKAINFGFFDIIVVPLLRSLKWIHGYVGNYGWSIVLLTVMINALMFPLRHKSVVSMRKMQEIQPEVKAIQDRYAKLKTTDPAKQKMNQELMALYKERGVNPASGCVPMVLTLPVLYAFYSLLQNAIELRGAPFFGWIHDLSTHDPLYITPVLMGVSQLWQQRITPATGADPVQQKTMMLMPVIFTVMFLWFPAGVALYWLVSNIWGIGQQYLTNYLIGPPNVRTVRPPAERKMKRVGGNKTEAAAGEG